MRASQEQRKTTTVLLLSDIASKLREASYNENKSQSQIINETLKERFNHNNGVYSNANN